jgi:hypothetical protein
MRWRCLAITLSESVSYRQQAQTKVNETYRSKKKMSSEIYNHRVVSLTSLENETGTERNVPDKKPDKKQPASRTKQIQIARRPFRLPWGSDGREPLSKPSECEIDLPECEMHLLPANVNECPASKARGIPPCRDG